MASVVELLWWKGRRDGEEEEVVGVIRRGWGGVEAGVVVDARSGVIVHGGAAKGSSAGGVASGAGRRGAVPIHGGAISRAVAPVGDARARRAGGSGVGVGAAGGEAQGAAEAPAMSQRGWEHDRHLEQWRSQFGGETRHDVGATRGGDGAAGANCGVGGAGVVGAVAVGGGAAAARSGESTPDAVQDPGSVGDVRRLPGVTEGERLLAAAVILAGMASRASVLGRDVDRACYDAVRAAQRLESEMARGGSVLR